MIKQKIFGSLRFAWMAAILLGVVACQTTSPATKQDTPDASFAKELISGSCSFGRGKNGFSVGGMSQKDKDQFIIRSIAKGEEGWWRIGYIWSGNYWSFFVNKKKRLAYCGEDTFRKQGGHRFRKVEETIPDNAMTIAFSKNEDSTSLSNQENKTICGMGLSTSGAAWESKPNYKKYVDEAERRGLTLQNCAKILGR